MGQGMETSLYLNGAFLAFTTWLEDDRSTP